MPGVVCSRSAVPDATSYNDLHRSSTKQVLAPFHVPNVKGIRNRKLVSDSGFAHSKVRAVNSLLPVHPCKYTVPVRALEILNHCQGGEGSCLEMPGMEVAQEKPTVRREIKPTGELRTLSESPRSTAVIQQEEFGAWSENSQGLKNSSIFAFVGDHERAHSLCQASLLMPKSTTPTAVTLTTDPTTTILTTMTILKTSWVPGAVLNTSYALSY